MRGTDVVETWQQAPAIPTARTREASGTGPLAKCTAAFLVGGAAPTVRAIELGRAPLVVAALAIGAIVALWRAPRTTRTPDVATALVVGALGALVAGPAIGVWLAVLLPLAAWLGLGRPPYPNAATAHTDALVPVGVLLVVAAVQGRHEGRMALAIIATGAAWVVAIVLDRHPVRTEAAIGALRRGVGAVLTPVLFGALAVLAVVLPWFANRLVVVDPLDPPKLRGTTWIPKSRKDVRGTRPWSPRQWAVGTPRWRRVRRPLGPVLAAVAVIAAASVVSRSDVADPILSERPAAFADEPWWDDYVDQMNFAFFTDYNPLRYPLMREVHTKYVNVENGERRTWVPPPCECRTVTAWMYGGSTVLGQGQRDDGTIPSALARRAWRDGISLEVHNKGALGELHWEGAQRFAWDVESDPAPDVVIFYDGYNDVIGLQGRERFGEGLDGTPVAFMAESYVREGEKPRRQFARLFNLFRKDPPPGATAPEPTVGAPLTGTEMGSLVADQYERSRQMAIHPAAAHDVEAFWFWQPSAFTKPHVEGEPTLEGIYGDYQREAFGAATAALAADVTDLSDVFDGERRPLVFDEVHTNEAGAALVAEAIYQRIVADLRLLTEAADPD